MKNKNTAGILALIFGWFGAHRFYLGQTGLGVMYILLNFIFFIPFLLGLIDAISFFTMSEEEFDFRYNNPDKFPARRNPGSRREYREFHKTQQRNYDYNARRKTTKRQMPQ